MNFGNIRNKPDLSPLFGQISPKVHDQMKDLLLKLDDRLVQIAHEATKWVGQPYQHTGLGLFVGERYSEIAGGPSGSAGDIWFEITYGWDAAAGKQCMPPWSVVSRIYVFCADAHIRDPYHSCMHELISLEEDALTPLSTIETLARHIDTIRLAIQKWKPAVYTNTMHEDLLKLCDDKNKS